MPQSFSNLYVCGQVGQVKFAGLEGGSGLELWGSVGILRRRSRITEKRGTARPLGWRLEGLDSSQDACSLRVVVVAEDFDLVVWDAGEKCC